ncbi:MAG: N-acetyl-gamma-glutamyl-phosphate reductase [Bacteroidetes bacterium]|nr:MAG: N-acetyl-gamma-glutamyl-phosphate reductase [Bacteroidota bacterium]
MAQIRVGILGGAGYTGGELVRLLLRHPQADIAFVQSGSNAGNALSSVHQDLLGETDLCFAAEHTPDVDVLFFCSGHGEAKKFLLNHQISPATKLIDIGNDFRLRAHASIAGRSFVYGLPEANMTGIQTAQSVANPGCFATAIQLGLLPLAQAGLLSGVAVHTTGITGSTGAGQALAASAHFSWRANNIQAYKTLTHQHVDEIMEILNAVQPVTSKPLQPVNFVPWRGDFSRGIFVSTQLSMETSFDQLQALFHGFYAQAAFTQVSETPIFLKQVVNTNKCIIHLEKQGNMLVVHSAIDNLLKGASGQAIQNMNLMFGLPQTLGLQLKAAYF